MSKKQIKRLSFLDFEKNINALTNEINYIEKNPSLIRLLNKPPKSYDSNKIFALDRELFTLHTIENSFPNAKIENETKIDDLQIYILIT